ncbi:hypothetical protein JVU11DRAFT_8400 [Chiua virens]|nr:hypothetical protein JVU11DRAFT_8400 [Chiua virens]
MHLTDTLRIVYEIAMDSTIPEPRLRLSSRYPLDDMATPRNSTHSTTQPIYRTDLLISQRSLCQITQALHLPPVPFEQEIPSDLIIPLPSDTAFFQLLTSTLSSLSAHLDTLHEDFSSALSRLAASISATALPASCSSPQTFTSYSFTTRNTTYIRPGVGGKSDLYTWREIFRLYAEAEIFESVTESSHGERSTVEVERQLKLFEEQIRDQKATLVLPGSRKALDALLNLNLFVLGMKKFELANSDATRKILKKHTKRTTLPTPSYLLEQDTSTSAPSSHHLTLITRPPKSLARLLVQAIGEVLLPIVPHIDDYSCLICTYIAFKPIRLSCGHFFCVRCLVKLQRRGLAPCPLCRAPTVLQANSSSMDYGLLNFMIDWFPVESREKMLANEQEVNQEQLEQLGIAEVRVCRIM